MIRSPCGWPARSTSRAPSSPATACNTLMPSRYLQNCTFDLNRVIRGWNEKLARASARGYAVIRVTGDTDWLEKKRTGPPGIRPAWLSL
jgi:hypothetical protein